MTEHNGKNGYLVGVDLGGTKILGGVFDFGLRLRSTVKISTKAQRGPDVVIDRIARCIEYAVDEADLSRTDIRGVGIGAPGAVDGETGSIIFAPNLNWREVPLQQELEARLGLPVYVENDCNIAALGVYVAELNAKPRSMIGIFMGTGIGSGVILNGEPFSGFGHTAGEIGHMVMQMNGPRCGCGNKGCFEALASRTAITRQIEEAIQEGQKTVLTEMLEDVSRLRSGDLRKALRRRDKLVERVVETAAQYTGVAVANLINILNPEVVVLGGGLIAALADQMFDTIVKTAKDYVMPGALEGVAIVTSMLGDHAGITGGAVLVRQKTSSPSLNGQAGIARIQKLIVAAAPVRTSKTSTLAAEIAR